MSRRSRLLKVKVSVLGVLVALSGAKAYSDEGMLMDCDRYDGEQEFQIFIDEVEGYVLYNAQVRDNSYEREREYSVVGGEEGPTVVRDDGLDIRINTESLIQANNNSSMFLFVKDTATYAYAWTTLAPIEDGKFIAFGNHHSGKCSTNPFAQLE